MPTRIFGPSKGNRRPAVAKPGASASERPTPQRGGGGNKGTSTAPVETVETVPSVTVSPEGQLTEARSPAYETEAKANRWIEAERRQAARSRRRVRRVRTYVRQRDKELTPKREVKVSKAFLQKAESPKPVTVTAHSRKLPGSEAPRAKPVKIAAHQRALPSAQEVNEAVGAAQEKADVNVMETGATDKLAAIRKRVERELGVTGGGRKGPELKGTPQERKEARANLRKAKRAVRRAGGSASGITTEVIQTPEQRKILQQVVNTGKRMGASRKELLSAIDTGIQETGFKNLRPYENSFNEDTAGWREELAPYYTNRLNVKKSAENYFNEAKSDPSVPGGGGESPGELAQTIQGSNYGGEETYGRHTAEAEVILNAFHGAGARGQAIKDLRAAKKEAKELGLKVNGGGVGKPPPKLVKRTTAAEVAMKEVDGLPYVLGGGHGSPTSSPTGGGLDCSGAVGYVLNKIGALKGSLTSGEMGSVLKPGPGALTVYYNPEHTFLSYVNKKGETVYWGTSVGDSGAGGLGTHPAPSAEYLSQYNVGHVPGMGRKQALQLGAEPGSFTSSGATSSPGTFSSQPGMTFSEGGTVATIERGKGTKKQGKPGFSNRPIELTPYQQLTKRIKRLKSLGVEVDLPGKESKAEEADKPGDASLHKQLRDLEVKYSIGAV